MELAQVRNLLLLRALCYGERDCSHRAGRIPNAGDRAPGRPDATVLLGPLQGSPWHTGRGLPSGREGAAGGFLKAIDRFQLSRIDQVGLVVRDLAAVILTFWERLGIGPWQIYTYGPPLVKEMTYRGRRQDYRMRVAFTMLGPLMLEVIEPIEGLSIYHEFLESGREGLHHVAMYVDDFEETVAALERLGYPVIQSGRGYGLQGDGAYAYLDTAADLGLILEVAQAPKVRMPPEAVFPPDI
ncbi:MAG: methylmalonyl-CoA epimerase [Chloroflexota bacterium]